MAKRQVEVFTAGCPVCEPAVEFVTELACPDCEVAVHDLRQTGEAFRRRLGGRAGRSVRDHDRSGGGSLVSCCRHGGPDRGELTQAGIGQRL